MATGRIKGITIEIGGDSTKLVKALSEVDKAIKNTQTNLRDINKALKFDPANTNLLKDKQRELANEIEQTKKKLDAEKQALDQMKSTEGFDANSEAARNLQTQIDLDTAALKELEAQARQSSSVLGSQMQVAGQRIQEVGDKIRGVGDKIAGLGQSLTTKVTVPIASAFGASIKTAVDWETAFTGVQKTVDATSEEYEQLAKNIQNMAKETASSANEIAGVMEIAGQLGIEGVDGLTTFTKTMVELGDTTNLTAEEAATALARFINITGESSEDIDKIGSAVVDLGNNFATSESEIVHMATRLAAAGKIAGLSSTDILALSASMSSVGIQAEAGGTAMTQTLSAMTAAVADFEAGSTEDLEKIANVANMSAKDFADTWNKEPIRAIQSFIGGLGKLDEKGENATLVLDELGMSGVRQANMLKSLSLASDVLTDAIDTSSQAYKENSALSEEAQKRYATMAARMSQLKARFTEVGIEIGQMLMPYLEKFITKIEGLVDKWKSLDDEQKKAVLKFAAIAAAIGPVLLVVGKLVSGIGGTISVVGKVVSIAGKLMTSLGGLSGVLGALSGPIGIAVAAIAALVAGFTYLFTTNEEFRNSIIQTATAVRANLQSALTAIKPALDSLKDSFSSLMNTLAPVFELIFTLIAGVVLGIANALEPIIRVVQSIIDFITNIIQAFIALLSGDIDGFIEHIQLALQAWLNGMLAFIQAHIAYVIGYFSAFGVDLAAIFTNIWNGIKLIVLTAVTNIKTTITTVWTTIKTWITTTITNIQTKFEEIFDKIKEAVTDRITKAKEAIVDGMQAAADFIATLPKKFYDWGVDMVQSLIDGINEKIRDLKTKISELAGMIASYIHFSVPDVGPLSNADEYMPDFVDLLIRGLDEGIPRLSEAMNGFTSNLVPQMQSPQMAGMTTNTFNINVYGAQGQDVTELADVIEQRITENVMRRGAAFG